jgi:glutathione S-transferase
MSAYRLHCFGESGNAYKAALMLELSGCDWEPVFVDFFNGATRDPAYRAEVNEMGEAPVLDHDGERMTQSGVILDYLADQTGKFRPEDAQGRRECWRWILFDNHKFTSYFATYRFLKAFMPPDAADPAVMKFLEGRMKSAWHVVERHLAAQDFLVGSAPTIADLSLAGYVYYPVAEHGIDIPAAFPKIAAWRDRIAALPGWKPPYELMPRGFKPAG